MTRSFVEHPDRTYVIEELHLRCMPPIPVPALVLQTLHIVESEKREAEKAYIQTLPFEPVITRCSARHCEAHAEDGTIILWERHSEASTTTLIVPASRSLHFVMDIFDPNLLDWLHHVPGAVMRATHIVVVENDAAAIALLDKAAFDPDELLSTHIDRTARIWSDFKVHENGFGHLLVAANGADTRDLGRMLQRLQELGNYRNLALMGLRVAQQENGALSNLETDLLEVTNAMQNDESDAEAMLDHLVSIATSVAALSAKTGFRLSATAAYTEIAMQRLEALDARSIAGYQSLGDFIERRLLPGARTCQTFERRLERLSLRTERATAQLRTRVDLAIQQQNSAMLASMERSASQQLHLQHMVEGLSVVAVSYYAIGLFGYLIKAVAHAVPIFDPTLATGFATLPIFGLVWLYLRLRTSAWRSAKSES